MRPSITRNAFILLIVYSLISLTFAQPLKPYLKDASVSYSKAGYSDSLFFSKFLPIGQITSVQKSAINSKSIESVSRQLLSENKELGIRPSNLKLQKITNDKPPGVSTSGYFFVFFEQQYNNVPVYGSEVKFLYIDDKLASMGAKYYPKINVNAVPKVNEKRAVGIAKTAVDGNKKDDETIYTSKLVILPISEDGAKAALVWLIDLASDSETDSYRVIIDAQTGKLLSKTSLEAHATISGNVTGMIWPHDPDHGAAIAVPFKDLNVSVVNRTSPTQSFGFATTNPNGSFVITYNPPPAASMLYSTLSYYSGLNQNFRNPWVMVELRNGQIRTSYNYTIPVDPAYNNWIWNDLSYPYRDRYQEPNVFYHLNKIHDFYVRGYDPFNLTEMNVRVSGKLNNLTGCTNASAASSGLYIKYGNDTTCNNALYSDVTYHEYGHILIGNSLYTDTNFIGDSNPCGPSEGDAMDEALGDYFATSINNESVVNPTTRNVSNSKRYPIDLTGECYGSSKLLTGSKWDLRKNFLQNYGYSGNSFTNNGTLRADAIILQTYKFTPRNYSQFFDTLIQVASGAAYQGNGDIFASPDRRAICDAFNFNHSFLPGVYPDTYCARKGAANPSSGSPFTPKYNFTLNSQVWANGSSFAPRTSANIYIMPHSASRDDGESIQGSIVQLNQPMDVYGKFNASLWTANQAGDFDIIIDTDRDGLYNSSIDSTTSFSVIAPSVTILSPLNTSYMNESILINLSSTCAGACSRVWYEWNGTNYTYSAPIYRQFDLGSNVLRAWANDSSNNIGSSSVAFIVYAPHVTTSSSAFGPDSDQFPPATPIIANYLGFPPNAQLPVYLPYDRAWSNGDPLDRYVWTWNSLGGDASYVLWQNPEPGSYDLIVDLDQNGLYTENYDPIKGITLPGFQVLGCMPNGAFCSNDSQCCGGACNDGYCGYPFTCDIMRPTQDVNAQEGQQHYFSIFNITPNEFPPYSTQTACRYFNLTNSGPITSMKIRNLLFDDEGYLVVNGHLVHYWWPRERAPLTMDIDFDLSNASLRTGAGETNEILAYVGDIYSVVYGGTVQIDVGSGAGCIAAGNAASQPSECCTGLSQDGVCVCKPNGTYAEAEEWSASLCCSGIYYARRCSASGAPPLFNCGDGACDAAGGENCNSCLQDCSCPQGTDCIGQGGSSGIRGDVLPQPGNGGISENDEIGNSNQPSYEETPPIQYSCVVLGGSGIPGGIGEEIGEVIEVFPILPVCLPPESECNMNSQCCSNVCITNLYMDSMAPSRCA
jgi:hypothetical protein